MRPFSLSFPLILTKKKKKSEKIAFQNIFPSSSLLNQYLHHQREQNIFLHLEVEAKLDTLIISDSIVEMDGDGKNIGFIWFHLNCFYSIPILLPIHCSMSVQFYAISSCEIYTQYKAFSLKSVFRSCHQLNLLFSWISNFL